MIDEINNNFIFCLEKVFKLNLDNDLIFIKDSNFKYVYSNEAYLKLFGVTFEDILGKDDTFFIDDPELLKNCRQSDQTALNEGFTICYEKAFNKTYEVLKFKINLNQHNLGILSWVKSK